MPTYDYVCRACGHQLEIFQSMSERPKRKCPECGANQLERQIGAGAGFLFKGSGYYLTDYRSDSYKKAAEKDASSAKETKSGSTDSGGGEKAAKAPKSKQGDAPASKPKKSGGGKAAT